MIGKCRRPSRNSSLTLILAPTRPAMHIRGAAQGVACFANGRVPRLHGRTRMALTGKSQTARPKGIKSCLTYPQSGREQLQALFINFLHRMGDNMFQVLRCGRVISVKAGLENNKKFRPCQ